MDEMDDDITPEQAKIMEQVVEILESSEGRSFTEEEKAKWANLVAELRETIAHLRLYGYEWRYKDWNLCLHGSKLLSKRYSEEEEKRCAEIINKMLKINVGVPEWLKG